MRSTLSIAMAFHDSINWDKWVRSYHSFIHVMTLELSDNYIADISYVSQMVKSGSAGQKINGKDGPPSKQVQTELSQRWREKCVRSAHGHGFQSFIHCQNWTECISPYRTTHHWRKSPQSQTKCHAEEYTNASPPVANSHSDILILFYMQRWKVTA